VTVGLMLGTEVPILTVIQKTFLKSLLVTPFFHYLEKIQTFVKSLPDKEKYFYKSKGVSRQL